MVDDVQFSILGLDSLLGKFEAIDYELKRKGGRSALRRAAEVVANAARANASTLDDPISPGSIEKNIALRWNGRMFKANGDLGFRVGVLGGAKGGQGDANPGGDTFYWRFLEFGTQKMRAQPFMRRALADNINEATNTFITEYEKAIDRAIKRAAKKAMPT